MPGICTNSQVMDVYVCVHIYIYCIYIYSLALGEMITVFIGDRIALNELIQSLNLHCLQDRAISGTDSSARAPQVNRLGQNGRS